MPRRRHGHASWTAVAAVTAAALAALPAAATTGQEACGTETARHAFRDVASGTTHDNAVSCIVAHRVTAGVTADEYAPAGTVSRAQMASFLHRIGDRTGAVTWGASTRYSDVPDSVHASAIRALASVDVTGGADVDLYRPADRLTRGEMATFLVELHEAVTRKRLPDAPDRFTDDTGHRHEPNTNRAYAVGLVGGYADGTFRPDQPVRRDQMATFLRRVLDRLVADGHLNGVGTPPPTAGHVWPGSQSPRDDAPALHRPEEWSGKYDKQRESAASTSLCPDALAHDLVSSIYDGRVDILDDTDHRNATGLPGCVFRSPVYPGAAPQVIFRSFPPEAYERHAYADDWQTLSPDRAYLVTKDEPGYAEVGFREDTRSYVMICQATKDVGECDGAWLLSMLDNYIAALHNRPGTWDK